VVIDHHCNKTIRLQNKFISETPSHVVRSWDADVFNQIYRWEVARGLLFYKASMYYDRLPECDSMLFVECPLSFQKFISMADRARRDVIVYCPPSWQLHEETVSFKQPPSDYHRAVLDMLKCFRGRDLTPIQEAALRYSGLSGTTTSVFSAREIEEILGINERQLRFILSFRFKGFLHVYTPYTPVVEPTLEPYLEMYRVLENEASVYRGARMLRFNELAPREGERDRRRFRIAGFKPVLKKLIRFGYVEQGERIYMMGDGFKTPDWDVIDSLGNVRRGQWYKMRNLIEAAPFYDLSSNSI
jgi:hypothetical protein